MRMNCEQLESVLIPMIEEVNLNIATHVHELKEQKILITTYQDAIKNRLNLSKFNFMICDEAQFLKNKNCLELFNIEHIKALGILQNLESSEDWFYDEECLYTYMTKDSVEIISNQKSSMRADIVAEKDKNSIRSEVLYKFI